MKIYKLTSLALASALLFVISSGDHLKAISVGVVLCFVQLVSIEDRLKDLEDEE